MWYLCSILYHMESKFSFTQFTPDEEKKILFDFIATPSSDPQRWQQISIISFRFTVITFRKNTGMGGESLKSLLRADILVYLQMALLMNNPLSLAYSLTLHHVPRSPRLCKLTLILVTDREQQWWRTHLHIMRIMLTLPGHSALTPPLKGHDLAVGVLAAPWESVR